MWLGNRYARGCFARPTPVRRCSQPMLSRPDTLAEYQKLRGPTAIAVSEVGPYVVAINVPNGSIAMYSVKPLRAGPTPVFGGY